MWYKRYGYKQPSGHDGLGCLTVATISGGSFVISVCIALLVEVPWLLLLVFPLAVLGFEVANRYALGAGRRIRKKRYRFHIDQAKLAISEGDKAAALESIRRTKIYGKLPDELNKYEKNAW